MALIDEALEIGGPDDMTGQLFHVVRGDLALLGPARDVASATASYERAIEMAVRFETPLPRLRAAVRLCSIATDAERPERIEAVRAVLATLTEGFTTPDLVEAAALLGD